MTFERLTLTRTQKEKFKKIRRLEQLQRLDPVEFEQFCGYLYERQGYKAHMTATSGDEGVDLLLTTGKRKKVVQCKRYQGSVGQPTVRDMYGTMLHTKSVAAAVVTTGRFTRAAEDWAANKPIDLVDGHELMSWVNRERRLAGGSRSWFRNNVGKLIALVLLCGVVLTLALGFLTFRQRTAQADGAVLVIPTPRGTTSAVQVPTVPIQTTEVVPTPTLRPQATGVADLVSAELTAIPLENYTLSTDPAPWAAIPAILPTHIVEQEPSWDETLDVSARFKFGYDADNLYGFVVVEDDVHVQNEVARRGYLGDSIELEIDSRYDRADAAQDDDFQYVISPGDFAERPAGAFRFRGNGSVMVDEWGTNATVVSEQTADGYVVAFQIPWFDLRMGRNQQAGNVLGMTVSINDNDDAGSSKQELMLSNVPERRWSQPNSWGQMTLGE